MAKQLKHSDLDTHYHNMDIIVICNNITTPENIGHIYRICDAMSVKSIIFCGANPLPNRTIRRVSRSTDKIVHSLHIPNLEDAIKKMQECGYHILALEITNTSIPLTALHIREDKIAIIIGNENFGIEAPILSLCDTITHIPMYGQNSSINVAMALSICLYAIISQPQYSDKK